MENTIKEIYERDFGTAYETYKSAVKVDNSIKLQDVKDYMSSRDDKQTHFTYKKYNSCISPGVSFEYEIDLMFMSQNDENIGLVAVDNFSKIDHLVVIKNKQPDAIIRGLKEIINKMGKPKQLYSDEEGSLMHLDILDS